MSQQVKTSRPHFLNKKVQGLGDTLPIFPFLIVLLMIESFIEFTYMEVRKTYAFFAEIFLYFFEVWKLKRI